MTSSSQTSAVKAAWNLVVEQLKVGPPASELILLENPFKSGQTPDSINVEYALGLQHMLLPVQPGKVARQLSGSIRGMCSSWMGGGTSCGDAVWDNFMMPKLQEAQKMIQKKQWRKAFGILLGLQLFASYDDDWIRDQEIYCEFGDFSGWFSDYSMAWMNVLGKSDAQLGLAVAGGKEGGYRGVLREMLEKWEKETNELLRGTFDEAADDEMRARVRMFSDPGSSEEEYGVSDEEEGEEDAGEI